jgi:hypothetical protein
MLLAVARYGHSHDYMGDTLTLLLGQDSTNSTVSVIVPQPGCTTYY